MAGDVPLPVQSAHVPEAYVNCVQFGVGVYDFALAFGLQRPASPADYVIRLHMSPQHALVMTSMLVNNIRAYEQQVGPITLPVALQEELKIREVVASIRASRAEPEAAAGGG